MSEARNSHETRDSGSSLGADRSSLVYGLGSSIRKAKYGSGYHVGGTLCHRLVSVERFGKSLGLRRLKVQLNNNDTYWIKQLDRGCFEIEGPHYNGPCEGWNDGLRLVNSI